MRLTLTLVTLILASAVFVTVMSLRDSLVLPYGVPLLAYAPRHPHGSDLNTRRTLSDMGQTVAENFGVRIEHGESFLALC